MSCARATISAWAVTGRQNTKWKRDSAATATIMLCRTLRCGKRLVTWKVRASPSAARRWTGKRVALVPRIQISPELGAVCADDGSPFAGLELQRYAIERPHPAEAVREIVDHERAQTTLLVRRLNQAQRNVSAP